MAALVSHAMRRFPTSPPDTSYSSYRLRGETSRHSADSGESALSRSMRYADPWLYSGVAPVAAGLLLAPALVLCTCPDYLNGTKRSSGKKSPTTCKKCKGTRLPISALDSSCKFGTVRCYPTSSVHSTTPLRAGTVRVTSSSRPTILPAASDPYDLMRRSRLAVTSDSRARSVSPKAKGEKEKSTTKSTGSKSDPYYNSTFGRRSILECDINPYELVSADNRTVKSKDASITLVNGQRIRVRPSLNDQDYEEVQVKQQKATPTRSAPPTPKLEKTKEFTAIIQPKPLVLKSPLVSSQPTSPDLTSRFKSILKKPTSFGDSDSSPSLERSPSPSRKGGSQKKGCQFYIPTPNTTPRKKVQFLVNEEEREEENEKEDQEIMKGRDRTKMENSSRVDVRDARDTKKIVCNGFQETIKEKEQDKKSEEKKTVTLKRSYSDSVVLAQKKSLISEALRKRKLNTNPKLSFNDLEKLDGITSRTRKASLNNVELNESCLSSLKENYQKEMKEITKEEKLEIIETPPNLNDQSKEETILEPKITEYEQLILLKTNIPDEQTLLDKLDKCIADVKSIEEQLDSSTPPSAPPRKRSNNKQPQIVIPKLTTESSEQKLDTEIETNLYCPTYSFTTTTTNSPHSPIVQIPSSPVQTVKVESPILESPKRTIVQVTAPPTVHKIQIKNEYEDHFTFKPLPVFENPQRKTSIMINGDDCYSTVNVNDNIPLYQSSVVVKDSLGENSSFIKNNKKSSTVYITGTFISNQLSLTNEETNTNNLNEVNKPNGEGTYSENISTENYNKIVTKDNIPEEESKSKYFEESNSETNTVVENLADDHSSDILRELLRDPVEAVRRNLVPHVCGKSDVPRRPRDKKLWFNNLSNCKGEPLSETSLDDKNIAQSSLEESFLRLKNYETICDDVCSEHSSSTQYELMDPGSDCYTDHSNRSSLTEEEMANRTKFYELLAEAALIEVSESEDHQYESIKTNNDPIYEEIEIPPPLPSNPPPPTLLDDLNLDKEFTTRSIFEGASKYDILSYLVDAKERGIVPEDSYTYSNLSQNGSTTEEETKETYNRVSQLSSVSDSSEDNSLIISGSLIDDKGTFQKNAEIERNDSGVGSETSKSSLSKYRSKQEISVLCEDCELTLETKIENEPLLCRKCFKKRSERKEIITEIVETEEKYSRDLQIILEEFYQPMLVAGLLTADQLSAIFLNVEELLENSQALAERLRDAVEIALEQGDDDLLTVNIGKLFLEATPMLHAFETYCVRQGGASLLLASLEKEKELLRIFLRVSQMENTMLRRMNLNSFLMVPVQRVTKYPLLLARLYKVTPSHHDNRDELKEAQHKIELHLNHMNSETKDVPSKLWRRIGSNSGRRSSAEMDLVNIKLRKIAVDVLEWNHEEAKFALEGKLLFTQPTDNNWRKGRTIKLTPINALLVINGKPSSKSNERSEENNLVFSRPGSREAALLLVRDKNGRYSLLRDPLYLDRCIIAADPAWQSYFEVQELLGKDTFIFKAEDEEQTQNWYKQLQFHAQGMGAWRKRRNALANIMINGMGLRS